MKQLHSIGFSMPTSAIPKSSVTGASHNLSALHGVTDRLRDLSHLQVIQSETQPPIDSLEDDAVQTMP